MRLLPLILAIAACGDPLANGDFTGDAKLKLSAIVCGETGEITATNPRFGVFWKWYEAGEASWVITDISVVEGTYPALVDVQMFDPPPTLAPSIVPSERGKIEADIGCPVLFDDVDDDGAFGENDELLAVSHSELLVFVRGQAAAASNAPYRLNGVPEAGEFGLFRGECTDGLPSGELSHTPNDHPVDVRFLADPMQQTSCVRFF